MYLHYRIFYIQIQICKYDMIISDDHCQGGTAGVAPGSATLATLQQPEDAARRMEAWNSILLLKAPMKPKHKPPLQH